MRAIFFCTAITALMSAQASAQKVSPSVVTILKPAECALISKKSDEEYYVEGPVTIGVATLTDTPVTRGFLNLGDVDTFEVISRSCFMNKRS
jgi:hypothetical protein